MLYICRECGEQISSGATRCPYCGAPPRPPLYGRPLHVRLLLRAGVLLMLALPILMLPVVLRWHNGSWDPCEWARDAQLAADAEGALPAVNALRPSDNASPAADSFGRCIRQWMDQVAR